MKETKLDKEDIAEAKRALEFIEEEYNPSEIVTHYIWKLIRDNERRLE